MIKIDFSQNLNPLRMDKYVKKHCLKFFKHFFTYPERFSNTAIQTISDFLGIKSENILLFNGLTEFYFTVPLIFKEKIKWFIAYPTFWQIPYVAGQHKAQIIAMHYKNSNDFKLDVEELHDKIKLADIIFLCNPNNPTSTIVDKKEIKLLLKKYKEKIFIIDETYLIFRNDYKQISFCGETSYSSNLIVITSLSKIFTLPGLRLGLICANKNTIKIFKAKMAPYQINSVAESIINCIFKDKKFLLGFLSETSDYIKQESERVYNELLKIKSLKIFKPEANFIFIKIRNDKRADDLMRYLNKYSIQIRTCAHFNGLREKNKYFRISIQKKNKNSRLIKLMKHFFKRV